MHGNRDGVDRSCDCRSSTQSVSTIPPFALESDRHELIRHSGCANHYSQHRDEVYFCVTLCIILVWLRSKNESNETIKKWQQGCQPSPGNRTLFSLNERAEYITLQNYGEHTHCRRSSRTVRTGNF
jgi:hypothetical protein